MRVLVKIGPGYLGSGGIIVYGNDVYVIYALALKRRPQKSYHVVTYHPFCRKSLG